MAKGWQGTRRYTAKEAAALYTPNNYTNLTPVESAEVIANKERIRKIAAEAPVSYDPSWKQYKRYRSDEIIGHLRADKPVPENLRASLWAGEYDINEYKPVTGHTKGLSNLVPDSREVEQIGSINKQAELERRAMLEGMYSSENKMSHAVFDGIDVEAPPKSVPKGTPVTSSLVDGAYIDDAAKVTTKAERLTLAQRFGKLGKGTKIGLGIGAGIVGLGLVGYAFSGKDDYYNTIEGLKHGGLAEGIRRSHSEFGSGWQGDSGLPSSLMGININPEILEYREDVIDDPDAYQDVLDDIAAKQKIRSAELGSFTDDDILARPELNFARINGLNAKNRKLKQVNLSDFNISVEDADTLILNRKGFFNTSKEIQIRLAGIDAPEVAAHSGDPLEDVRYQQEQAGGLEASEALRDLIDQQDDLSLVIGGEKTYGRYVGALVGDDSVLNVDLLKSGAVSALPFGSRTKDVVDRDVAYRAQEYAREEGAGIWGMARYQAIGEVHDKIGQAITFNTLTRVDKLAKNLNLGAYQSFLENVGEDERRLTREEEDIASRIGYTLRKTHGPKKRGYNKFEGLHPGSNGMGAWSVRSHSDFGSNAIIKAGLGKVSGAVAKLKKGLKSSFFPAASVSGYSQKEIRALGKYAKTDTVNDFAKRVGVEVTSISDDTWNLVNKDLHPALQGGAFGILPESIIKTNKKTLGPFKQGKGYIDVDLFLDNTVGAGFTKKYPEVADAYVKTAIFHEATELRNAEQYASKHGIFETLKNTSTKAGLVETPAHTIATVQEELFLRSIGNKRAYQQWGNFRNKQQNYTRFSGKDDAWNTIEGLRHGGLSEKIRKMLTDFGSGSIIKAGLGKVTGAVANLFSRSKRIKSFNNAYHIAEKAAPEYNRLLKQLFGNDVQVTVGGGKELGSITAKAFSGNKQVFSSRTHFSKSPVGFGDAPIDSALRGIKDKIGIDLTDLEIEQSLRGQGLGSKFTKGEIDIFQRLGLEGVYVQGIPTNPITAKQQVHLYGASLQFSKYKRDVAKMKHSPEEYMEMLLNKDLRAGFGEMPRVTSHGTVPKKITKSNRAINEIEGMHPGSEGLGTQSIRNISHFGTKFDAVKALAQEVGMNFDDLIKSKQFKSAVQKGFSKGGKQLGEVGGQGTVYSYSGILEHSGKKYPFSFAGKHVVKSASGYTSGEVIKAEAGALKELGDLNVPSFYGKGSEFGLKLEHSVDDIILMEKFEDAKTLTQYADELEMLPMTIGERQKKLQEYASGQIEAMTTKQAENVKGLMTKAHDRGFVHTDLQNPENILNVWNPIDKRRETVVIDWGLANRFENSKGVGGFQKLFPEQEAAVKSIIGNKSLHEYSQLTDIAQVDMHAKIGNQAYNTAATYGTGWLAKKQPEEIKTIVDTIMKGRSGQTTIKGKIAEVTNPYKTAPPVRKGLSQEERYKRIRQREMEEAKTILPTDTMVDYGRTMEEQIAWRMERFKDKATQAHGSSLRAAHNAGKGHYMK